MIREPKNLSDRLPEILERLGLMSHGFEAEPCSAALLADAYRWYYASGKHTYGSDGKDYHSNNLESFEVLDALLNDDPQAIFDANEALRARNAPPKGQLAGFRLNDSNISVSPRFGESFHLIPDALQGLVVEKLKEIARQTADGERKGWKRVRSDARCSSGMVTLLIRPGIHLCVEFDYVSKLTFMGFLVPGTYRPLEGQSGIVRSGSSVVRAIAKLAFVASLLLLTATMIYVPYDAVMRGKGAAMQVFNSYGFVWADPDLNKVCSWYLEVELEGFTRAARGCYAVVAIPRLMLTVGAAALLALGCFFWMKGTSRGKA